MFAKLNKKSLVVLPVIALFIFCIGDSALAKWSHSDEGSESKGTIPSSASSFTSNGVLGKWNHDWDNAGTNTSKSTKKTTMEKGETVTADVSGEFKGQPYVKTETTSTKFNLANGKELTSTSVIYYNDKGQKVGAKNEFGGMARETTFEYDDAGNLTKKVAVITTNGWTDKPENGGKEFTRVQTQTSLYTYEDVTDAEGNVTGQKVTETTTTERQVNGETKESVSGTQRVKVTISDANGKTISTTITTTYADGRKKVYEDKDGQKKTTHYDKDGNEYQPKRWSNKEALDLVFGRTKGSDLDKEANKTPKTSDPSSKTTVQTDDSGNTVSSDVAGTFQGIAYVRTEATTTPLTSRDGNSYTATKTTYYNQEDQEIGYQIDVNMVDGDESTVLYSKTGLYDYEDVTDADGKVTGQKVTLTVTSVQKSDGVDEELNKRVTVTVTDINGEVLSDITTITYASGRKIVNERQDDGTIKLTRYDEDGNVEEEHEIDWDRIQGALSKAGEVAASVSDPENQKKASAFMEKFLDNYLGWGGAVKSAIDSAKSHAYDSDEEYSWWDKDSESVYNAVMKATSWK